MVCKQSKPCTTQTTRSKTDTSHKKTIITVHQKQKKKKCAFLKHSKYKKAKKLKNKIHQKKTKQKQLTLAFFHDSATATTHAQILYEKVKNNYS